MFKPNQVIDKKYVIKEKTDSSNVTVYSASGAKDKRKYAIRLARTNPSEILLSKTEADLIRQINHPAIAPVYDFVFDGADCYIVTEAINGDKLSDTIQKNGMAEPSVKDIAIQLCEAVSYLHTRYVCVLHTDINPSCITLRPNNTICLTDYNISSVFKKDGSFSVCRNDGYSAPEQYISSGTKANAANPENTIYTVSSSTVDERSDVYSIGAVMYHMLTGTRPEKSTEEVKPISEFSNVGKDMVKIVSKAMQKMPEKRYSSVTEMLNDLKNARTVAVSEKTASVNPKFIGIGAAAVAVIVIIAAIASKGGSSDPIVSDSTNGGQASPDSQSELANQPSGQASPAGPDLTSIPDVVGMNGDDAKLALENAGLMCSINSLPSDKPEGTVLYQSINGGSAIPKGYNIEITISSGEAADSAEMIALPQFIGLTRADAEAKAKELGISCSFNESANSAPKGTVISQSVPMGASVPSGFGLSLTLSAGPDTEQLTQAAAMQYTISASASSVKLKEGETGYVDIMCDTNKFSAASSNTSVATLSFADSGSSGTYRLMITAHKAGTSQVLVSLNADTSVCTTINVTVTGTEAVTTAATTKKPENTVAVREVGINEGNSLEIAVGDTYTLGCFVLPKNADQSVTYESSKPAVVSVDVNGRLIANKVGSAKVRVTSVADPTVSKIISINIVPAVVKLESLSYQDFSIKSGQTASIMPAFTPADTTQKNLEWFSSDTDVLSVDKYGNVTAHLTGKATLTIKSLDNPNIYCVVYVTVVS